MWVAHIRNLQTSCCHSECTHSVHLGGVWFKSELAFVKKNPTRCNSASKFYYFIFILFYFIIPYLYEAQHVSGDTLPVIRSLKLHWQPLVFLTWKVVVYELYYDARIREHQVYQTELGCFLVEVSVAVLGIFWQMLEC